MPSVVFTGPFGVIIVTVVVAIAKAIVRAVGPRQWTPFFLVRLLPFIIEISTPTYLGFVHLQDGSGGERQGIGEAIEEGTRDFDDVVG